MMTPAEKKRLTWSLIAIFFLFANLILGAFLVFQRLSSPAPATTGTQPVSTTRP